MHQQRADSSAMSWREMECEAAVKSCVAFAEKYKRKWAQGCVCDASYAEMGKSLDDNSA